MRAVPDACVRGVWAWPPVRRLIKRERRLRYTRRVRRVPTAAYLPTYRRVIRKKTYELKFAETCKKKKINYDIVLVRRDLSGLNCHLIGD